MHRTAKGSRRPEVSATSPLWLRKARSKRASRLDRIGQKRTTCVAAKSLQLLARGHAPRLLRVLIESLFAPRSAHRRDLSCSIEHHNAIVSDGIFVHQASDFHDVIPNFHMRSPSDHWSPRAGRLSQYKVAAVSRCALRVVPGQRQ